MSRKIKSRRAILNYKVGNYDCYSERILTKHTMYVEHALFGIYPVLLRYVLRAQQSFSIPLSRSRATNRCDGRKGQERRWHRFWPRTTAALSISKGNPQKIPRRTDIQGEPYTNGNFVFLGEFAKWRIHKRAGRSSSSNKYIIGLEIDILA